MPRLLSTAEIIEIRATRHPEFHDDSCEVCALFSTIAGLVSLLDMRAEFDPDEPRDDHGRWTSGGGGDDDSESSGGGSVEPTSTESLANMSPDELHAHMADVTARQNAGLAAGADTLHTYDMINGVEGKFTAEREQEQQKIIDGFLNKPGVQSDHKLILMAGLPGAGKTTFLNNHAQQLGIDQASYVVVNPDDVKVAMQTAGMVPDYSSLGLTQQEVGSLIQEEASLTAQKVAIQASAQGKNIIVDSTMKSNDQLNRYKNAINGMSDVPYNTTLILIDETKEESVERAVGRYQRGGRFVPTSNIENMKIDDQGRTPPRVTFDNNADKVDRAILVDGTTREVISDSNPPALPKPASVTDDVYKTPIEPLDADILRNDPDMRVVDAVEGTILKQAVKDNPTIDYFGNGPTTYTQYVPVAGKTMVATAITARMDPKYDTQLLGTNGGKPVTSLLTANDVWIANMSASPESYNYFGPKDEYLQGLSPDEAQKALEDSHVKLGDDPQLRTLLREDAVSNLVSTWAKTSNDHSVESLAMQESAVKEFGLKDTAKWNDPTPMSYTFIDNSGQHYMLNEHVQKELSDNGEMYQNFLRAQYDSTQQLFKDQGISTVNAYRGFDFSGYDANGNRTIPDWADPGNSDEVHDNDTWTADVPLRPLSSFSYSESTAKGIFAGDLMDGGDTGRVISGEVPVSRILSTAATGMGCLGEREMVLLGGTDKWTVQ